MVLPRPWLATTWLPKIWLPKTGRRYRVAMAILGAVVALASGRAAAESLELPAETWLDSVPIVVELDGATIEVLREPTAKPALRAKVRSGSGEKPVLHITRGEARLEIRRGDSAALPLILELILDVDQPLRIAGGELEITAVGGGEEASDGGDGSEGVEGAASAAGGAMAPAVDLPVFDVDVERSTLHLTGVSGGVVQAVDSHLFAEATGGTLTLRLEGGDAEIRNHRGKIDLRGLGAEVWLAQPEGAISFTIEGGSFRLRDGRGNATGVATDGLVELDGWFGPLAFNGTGGTLEYRASRELRSRLTLTGTGLDATVSGLAGMLQAVVRGGRLQVTDKLGNTRIQATEGAEISIDRAGGNLILSLHHSSARLVDVRAPQIKVDLRDGRLDGERIRHLELVAERGEVYVGGLEELGKTEVADTRMELDLTRLEKPPVLTLLGTSEAFVRLATPCAVELSDAQLLSDAIGVTGCELHSASNRRRHPRIRGAEGNRRLTLKATVSEDSHLEVEGYP
ncbi:MAG: hypothetical protein V3T72_10440 [Thermoanaerobaculia bacterium]